MISISEIVNGVQQIGAGALVIVKKYILDLIWGNDSTYLFDSLSKDENGNLSSFGTAVLLKFDTHWKIMSDQIITILSLLLCIFKYYLQKFTALPLPGMPLNMN